MHSADAIIHCYLERKSPPVMQRALDSLNVLEVYIFLALKRRRLLTTVYGDTWRYLAEGFEGC